MISKKMEQALNQQINQEFASAYIYLSLAAYFSRRNLNGFAHWMRLQFSEELEHAGKLFDHVIARDGNVTLTTVPAPPSEWSSTESAVQAAYDAEVQNTAQINTIMNVAADEGDHATRVMLQWFVEEQVEEEASALTLVEQVRLAGDNSGALFILDRELGARQPAPVE